jgi:hypothetical protein
MALRTVNTQTFMNETPEALLQRLRTLEKQVEQLIEAYRITRNLLKMQQEENLLLKNGVLQQNEENIFTTQENFNNIVKSLGVGAENVEELRIQIDNYLHKLDTCIAFLGKQLL